MNLTRVRATIVAGILASSMVLPGVTAMAADGDGATTGEATIKKTVTVANDDITAIPDAHKSITFSVKQVDNEDGIIAPNHSSVIQQGQQGYYDKTVTIDVNDLSSGKSFEQAILTGANISLNDVGEYTFEIKEMTAVTTSAGGDQTTFGWTKVDGTTYYLRVLIKNDASAATGKTTYYFLTTTKGDTTVANKLTEAEFTNIYNKKSTTDGGTTSAPNTLTVTKEVVNPEYVSASNKYDIMVTVTLPNTQKNASDQFFIANGDYAASVVKGCSLGNSCNADVDTRNDKNLDSGTVSYTGHLHKGDSIQITNLAVGAQYTVAEQNVDDMKSKMNLDSVSYKLKKGADESVIQDTTNNTFGEESATVTVTNTFKSVTATGVVTDIAPYLTLILVAGAGVAGYMVLKGRMAR